MMLTKMLIRDEDLRLKPYTDSVGKLTIGVGRNLDDKGVSEGEAMSMLGHDILETITELHKKFIWFNDLDSARADVVVSMAFNMGVPRFSGFKKTIAHIEHSNYHLAAAEMLDSKWATQVGDRSTRLSNVMNTGEYGEYENG